MRLGANAANYVRRALLCAWYRTTGKRPLYLALCWIWDLGSAVLQGTLRICMPAHYTAGGGAPLCCATKDHEPGGGGPLCCVTNAVLGRAWLART